MQSLLLAIVYIAYHLVAEARDALGLVMLWRFWYIGIRRRSIPDLGSDGKGFKTYVRFICIDQCMTEYMFAVTVLSGGAVTAVLVV